MPKDTPTPTSAEAHPLLTLLSRVPFNADIRDSSGPLVYYADISAAEAVRIRPVSPADYAAYASLDAADRDFWLQTVAPLDLPLFPGWLGSADLMQTRIGYDLFMIDRLLTAGVQTPLTLIQGNFDTQAITTAHRANGYTASTHNNLTTWCSPNGCEHGDQFDSDKRFTGQLFGADRGYEQSFVVDGDVLISSPDYTLLTSSAAAIHQETESMLDFVVYDALAHALTDRPGLLIQAHFYGPSTIPPAYDLSVFPTRADFDAALERQQDPTESNLIIDLQAQWLAADYGLLQENGVFAVAQRQEGDEQVALLPVAYNIPPDAEAALPELEKRLKHFLPVPNFDAPYVYYGQDVYIAIIPVRRRHPPG